MRQSGLTATSAERWLVEGAFHVLFCVGFLARTNNFDLANYESYAGLIGDAMHAVKQMLAAGIDMPIRRSRQLIFAF